jgi:hypothetical protein
LVTRGAHPRSMQVLPAPALRSAVTCPSRLTKMVDVDHLQPAASILSRAAMARLSYESEVNMTANWEF